MFGIAAYCFVFLIMECTYLKKPYHALLVILLVIGLTLVMGVVFPFLGNFANIGGLVFGFFLSWIVVQNKSEKYNTREYNVMLTEMAAPFNQRLKELQSKENKTLTLKFVMMGISVPISIILFVVCLLWLYIGQDNWFGFTYLNCIPYTPTFCMDYGQTLQTRNHY